MPDKTPDQVVLELASKYGIHILIHLGSPPSETWELSRLELFAFAAALLERVDECDCTAYFVSDEANPQAEPLEDAIKALKAAAKEEAE